MEHIACGSEEIWIFEELSEADEGNHVTQQKITLSVNPVHNEEFLY